MGLLMECPGCKKRHNPKSKVCRCGVNLAKASGRTWWIEYYWDGQRKRERIGPNKTAAEQRLREVLTARTEGRFIKKSPETTTRFRALAQWYLELDKVKAKRSYDRDRRSVDKLCLFFGDSLLKDITPASVEKYLHRRLAEPSYRGHLTKPATVNRELACLSHIFSNAIRNDKAGRNPVQGVKRPPENNERDRVLTSEEYDRLIAECPHYIEPVVNLAYHTGMRRGEILRLTWDQIDLTEGEGWINLLPGAENKPGRPVPLHPKLLEMFKAMPRGLPGEPVFTRNGKPITGSNIRVGLEMACRRAGIECFTFHDLRHTFNTNAYKAEVPIPTIMKITGHKTLTMFKRYTTINNEDLKAAVMKIKADGHQYGHQAKFDTYAENGSEI
jgi:integrase